MGLSQAHQDGGVKRSSVQLEIIEQKFGPAARA
jgi:hypothetical protein